MGLTLYGIRNCDTVKRARTWLQARGMTHDFHDYKIAGLDARTLQEWIEEVGWEPLLNRQGTTFRKLPEAQRLGLDGQRALQLMLAQPSIVRRPVLRGAGPILVGFDPAAWEERLSPDPRPDGEPSGR